MPESKPVKLKPVVYMKSPFSGKHSPQRMEQIMLLKALQITQDPHLLKKMVGFGTVAQVYRTLDKMAIRREYHESLARAGWSLDFVVEGIKNIAERGEKDADRLNAFKVIIKSLGLEKYDVVDAPSGGSWEDALMKAMDTKDGGGASQKPIEIPEYNVVPPEIPEQIQRIREDEEKISKSIYE